MKAEELSDEMLLQMAIQGIDQRSDRAKKAIDVTCEVKVQDPPNTRGVDTAEKSEDEVYTVTLLEGRYIGEAGNIIEEYSSTVIVPYSSVISSKTEKIQHAKWRCLCESVLHDDNSWF